MAKLVTYVGERDSSDYGALFVEVRDDSNAPRRMVLKHVGRHSPTGMEWGYAGSGPADLANSILSHAMDVKGVSAQLYQSFKADVICGLPEAGFRLDQGVVMTWLNKRWSEMDDADIKRDLVP